MSVPISRLGDEAGWTTNHYYSKHESQRLEIWRHQWKMRLDLDDNRRRRDAEERKRLEHERAKRDREQQRDLEDRRRRDKLVFEQLPRIKAEDKRTLREGYRKELERTIQDTTTAKENEDIAQRTQWTRDMAKIRKQRRERREEDRAAWRKEEAQRERDSYTDSYYLVHANLIDD